MEKLHSLPKLVLDSEEARAVQLQYDHLIVEMDQFEKATVEVCCNSIAADANHPRCFLVQATVYPGLH